VFAEKLLALLLRLFPSLAGKIHYIGGPETLPPPLSAEEEAALCRRNQEGDSQAEQLLIVHNLRLVVYIARRFDNASTPVEDLISIGTIGLIKAVRSFCPGKSIKLATYASRCIENEILMHLRKIGSLKHEVSLDEPLNVDWDGNELLLCDVLGTENDVVGKNVEREAEIGLLRRAVENLPERERVIMQLRFGLAGGKELTQKEVADKLGISQSYISRLEKRIIRHLREELTADGAL